MTFSIHDAFKAGDKVRNHVTKKVGYITKISEHAYAYPYQVKYEDGDKVYTNQNDLVCIKAATNPKPFKLYDTVEVIDPIYVNFLGKKGIVAYIDKEYKQTRYRIQNEEKTQRWYAYESQLKLVSNEQEEIKRNKTRPDHYKNSTIEVWEMMLKIWGKEKFIAFCEMNAFKYRMRAGDKDKETIKDDIRKAQWYENKIKELNGIKQRCSCKMLHLLFILILKPFQQYQLKHHHKTKPNAYVSF